MADPINSRLIYEILKDVQAPLAHPEGMRDEMREGFASVRAIWQLSMVTQRSWSGG